MKAEPIIREAEAVKERLAEHPHPGPSVGSPDELQERLRHREATEPPPPGGPYRNHDPIIAEVHRIREKLYREREAAP